MSLLSLVAPDVPVLWRVTFATAGVAGLIGSLLLVATMGRRASDVALVFLLQWVAVPLYAVVTMVAVNPDLASGIGLTPLQVEGITLVVLILLGTQSAWLVTFARTD
jgi:hypothetical protein